MNEQTRNELSAKLEELLEEEKMAWKAYQDAEAAYDLAALKSDKEERAKVWHGLNKAVEGIKALLSLEGK